MNWKLPDPTDIRHPSRKIGKFKKSLEALPEPEPLIKLIADRILLPIPALSPIRQAFLSKSKALIDIRQEFPNH